MPCTVNELQVVMHVYRTKTLILVIRHTLTTKRFFFVKNYSSKTSVEVYKAIRRKLFKLDNVYGINIS